MYFIPSTNDNKKCFNNENYNFLIFKKISKGFLGMRAGIFQVMRIRELIFLKTESGISIFFLRVNSLDTKKE